MVAPRAVWKGFLTVGFVTCGVKLVGATSESSKIHFKILNRKDGLPVKTAYLDEETGDAVASEDQTKGFEVEKGEFIEIERDEIKKLKLTSQHTLEVGEFVAIDDIETRYLEKPYYVIPADGAAAGILRVAGSHEKEARSRQILCSALSARARGCHPAFRQAHAAHRIADPQRDDVREGRLRRSQGSQIRSRIAGIASLLIDKKVTKFDPSKFVDTYEDALIAMIDAKRKGKKPPKPASRPTRTWLILLPC
ncbi:Ku protein [Mesorhizobium sp. ORM8.1]